MKVQKILSSLALVASSVLIVSAKEEVNIGVNSSSSSNSSNKNKEWDRQKQGGGKGNVGAGGPSKKVLQQKMPFSNKFGPNQKTVTRDLRGGKGGSNGATSTSPKPHGRTKSGKSSSDQPILPPQPETFLLAPFSCPNQCIDASNSSVNESGQLGDAIAECDFDAPSQQWIPHETASFIKLESLENPNTCISIDYRETDSPEDIPDICSGGYFLALSSCDSPATDWYFSGGQMFSGFCWMNGISTSMSVFYDGDTKECASFVYGNGSAPNDVLTREETFVFISTL